jgi:adenine deaminase
MKQLIFVLTLLISSYITNAQVQNIDVVIENINIVDVVRNKIIPNQTIYIQKDKIVAIEKYSLSKKT